MMLIARVLAGISLGSVNSVTFTYFGVSYDEYIWNQKVLEIYSDKKKAERMKGYIFSCLNHGMMLGPPIGLGRYNNYYNIALC